MESWQIVTAVTVAYLLFTLAVGLISGRRSSSSVQGFVAADRGFGLLVMYFVIGATAFSAFAFLGGPGWAYSRGAAAFYILSYGVVGMAPWYFLGPRAAALGRRFGYVTQAQLLVGRFPSRTLSALLALLSLAAFVPYITLQMSGAGLVFSAVTEGRVPFWLGAALAYGVVLLYVLLGGASAVGWTNVVQGIFMIGIAWSLGLYLPYLLYGGIRPMFEQIALTRPELLTAPGLTGAGEPWSWGAYSSAVVVSAIGFSMWPHLFMKAFAAQSDDTLRRTVVLFPSFQLFLVPVLLIGFAGVLFPTPPANADAILPHMILSTQIPALIVGLFCAGALAASMSTGDALLHATASILVEDGVRPFRKMTDRGQRLLMQALVVAVGLAAYGFALRTPASLVQLLLGAYGVVVQIAPLVVAALFWRRATTAGALAGLLAGVLTTSFFFLNPALRWADLHEGLFGVIANVAALVGVSLLTPAQPTDRVEPFLDPHLGQRAVSRPGTAPVAPSASA
ncbi:MAG TPA: sodium:solute symporter family protein [Longimicrobiaceae bacterium]|nr:sodium:solute symporter family protein [Longimicrobiaceae bacterium]